VNVQAQLKDLQPAAKAWAGEVLEGYSLTPTGEVLVVEAARCLSIIEEARETRASIIAQGRYRDTERTHPSLTVERQARQDLLRCLAALEIQQEEDGDDG
jgi:hypothetical protein